MSWMHFLDSSLVTLPLVVALGCADARLWTGWKSSGKKNKACLHEQTVSVALGLEITSVKLINQKGMSIMEKYKDNKNLRKSVGVFCTKNSGAALTLVSAAHSIYASNRFIFIVHIISQIVAAVFMLLAVLFNIKVFFNPLAIVLYLLFWSVLSIAITQRSSIIRFVDKLINKGRQ